MSTHQTLIFLLILITISGTGSETSGNKNETATLTIHSIVIQNCNDDESCNFFFEIEQSYAKDLKYPEDKDNYFSTNNAENISVDHTFFLNDIPEIIYLKVVEHKGFGFSDQDISTFEISTRQNISNKVIEDTSNNVVIVISLVIKEKTLPPVEDDDYVTLFQILLILLFFGVVGISVYFLAATQSI